MNRYKMVVIENSRDGYECTNDQVSEGARQRGNETLECKWGSTRCLTSLVGERDLYEIGEYERIIWNQKRDGINTVG